MTRQTPTVDTLKLLSLRLRNADPETWDQWVHAFHVYTVERAIETVGAGSDTILVAQGAARQCQALLRVFQECHIQKQPQTPQP